MKTIDISKHLLWKKKLSKAKFIQNTYRDPSTNPEVAESLVFTSVFSPGYIFANNKSDGSLRWKLKLNYLGGSNPVFYRRLLYCTTAQEALCIDPLSGKVIWSFSPSGLNGEHIYSGLSFDNERVHFGDRGGALYCLNSKTGGLVWKTNTGKYSLNATPVIHKNFIITCSNGNTLAVFNKKNGKKIWQLKTKGASTHHVTVSGNNIVASSSNFVSTISLSKRRRILPDLKLPSIYQAIAIGNKICVIAEKTSEENNTQEVFLQIYKNGKLDSECSLGNYIFSMTQLQNEDLLCITGFSSIQIYSLRNQKIIYTFEYQGKDIFWPGAPLFTKGKAFIATHYGLLLAMKLPPKMKLESKKTK